MNKKELILEMKNAYQIEGTQTILEHGLQVNNYFKLLIDELEGKRQSNYLPNFVLKRKEKILKTYYKHRKSIHLYLVFHDCGKPFCKTKLNNKTHFYNHENISYEIFQSVFDNPIASHLIKNDMLLHKARANNVLELSHVYLIDILCLAYIAEIYANKEIFGGEFSESFKIKKKQMESKIKKLFN